MSFVDEKLRELVQEVAELFKNLVGHEIFSQAYTAAKQSVTEAKAKRKMQNAFEVRIITVHTVLSVVT
jgi:hypothetical protein